MLAYHSKPELKEECVSIMAVHRKADELVKGQYWENGKGCAVGCLIKGSDHSKYETMFGIPRELAYLEDRIFENLENGDSQEWPERFLNAINPGADLSMIISKLMLWILTDPDGILKHANPDGRDVIGVIAALYVRKIAGEIINSSEWFVARNKAIDVRKNAAADAYAYADAAAAADAAAYAAAYAYAYADADAAAYADAAAAADARKKFWVRCANKLIELLEATPKQIS